MTLKEYLSAEQLTYSDFGRRLGIASWSVKRYAEHGRVPEPSIMKRIVEATAGAVQPNDFYEAA